MSWTMTVMLSVAAALGVVGVAHTFQAPQSASAIAPSTATSTTTHPVVYTTYRGDDGSRATTSGATTTHYDN